MRLNYKDTATGGEFNLVAGEEKFDRNFFMRDRDKKYLTIAWNRGMSQNVVIDGMVHTFPANAILPLMVNQSFEFENSNSITAWQFNREFYCIVDHDSQVSCAGFLFYGPSPFMVLQPRQEETAMLESLQQVLLYEFKATDTIQGEMLRLLLVRLVIMLTRIAKSQYLDQDVPEDARFSLYRSYNIMVENNYRTRHEVAFYAAALNKSPKTLANVFALYGKKSPLQIIQDRIIIEAKRLFYYTDKSVKEVAAETGFEEVAHFSRFFKNQTGLTPSLFKDSLKNTAVGKIGNTSGSIAVFLLCY